MTLRQYRTAAALRRWSTAARTSERPVWLRRRLHRVKVRYHAQEAGRLMTLRDTDTRNEGGEGAMSAFEETPGESLAGWLGILWGLVLLGGLVVVVLGVVSWAWRQL